MSQNAFRRDLTNTAAAKKWRSASSAADYWGQLNTTTTAGWVEVENLIDKLEPLADNGTSSGVRVWISTGTCGLLLAVREDSLGLPPPLNQTGACPPSSPMVGLQTSQNKWKYRRAFGGCFDCTGMDAQRHGCNYHNFQALSDPFPKRPEACAQVSTPKAWWLDDEKKVYALQLAPFHCTKYKCAPTISIFGGMDHCQQPLEVLGADDITQPNVTENLGCVYPLTADVRPLATVHVPQSVLEASEQRLDYGCGRWTEDGSRWEVTQQAQPQELAASNKKEVKSLCLIGDSHFERNPFLYKTMPSTILGVDSNHVKLNINFMMTDGLEAPARLNVTVKQSLEDCHNWLPQEEYGAIILSVGSHQPKASIADLETLVNDLEVYLDSQAPERCVLVSSTLDSCHGNIPAHFQTKARLAQNTWREAAKSAVTQAAIENSRLSNVHFVDLFAPSAALHFGHCERGDPVHWSRGVFYEEHFRILFEAVRNNCGLGKLKHR